MEGRNKDGGPYLWVLQTQPASVRNILTSSAFCLEEETLDNRNSVFLINPDNRQLIDALQLESDISDVRMFLTGSSRVGA